jgi:hypothetical protein
MKINRLAVNAAIEKLLAGTDKWEEHARIIIRNCHLLRPRGYIVLGVGPTTVETDEEIVTGHCPEGSDISIHDTPRKETREWEFGISRERIGYFKVWRERDSEIGIQHWWKASMGTRSPEDPGPLEYFLGYDKTNLEPMYFGAEHEEPVFTFVGMEFYRIRLEVIHGAAGRKRLRRGGGFR